MSRHGANPQPEEPEDINSKKDDGSANIDGVIDELRNVISNLGKASTPPEPEELDPPAPEMLPPESNPSESQEPNLWSEEGEKITEGPLASKSDANPNPADDDFWSGNVLGWTEGGEDVHAQETSPSAGNPVQPKETTPEPPQKNSWEIPEPNPAKNLKKKKEPSPEEWLNQQSDESAKKVNELRPDLNTSDSIISNSPTSPEPELPTPPIAPDEPQTPPPPQVIEDAPISPAPELELPPAPEPSTPPPMSKEKPVFEEKFDVQKMGEVEAPSDSFQSAIPESELRDPFSIPGGEENISTPPPPPSEIQKEAPISHEPIEPVSPVEPLPSGPSLELHPSSELPPEDKIEMEEPVKPHASKSPKGPISMDTPIDVPPPPPPPVSLPGTMEEKPDRPQTMDEFNLDDDHVKPKGLIQIACFFPEGKEKQGQQFVSSLKVMCEKSTKKLMIQPVFVQPWNEKHLDVRKWAESAQLAGADWMFVLAAKADQSKFADISTKVVQAGIKGRMIFVEQVALRALYADVIAGLRRSM